MGTPTLYGEDGSETQLPWKWAICSRCEGHATDRGASVECEGGGFTASEWAEQDDDFKADYLAGRYDRPCPYCQGGRVKKPDWPRLTLAQKRAWNAQMQADREIDAILRMERRMGA